MTDEYLDGHLEEALAREGETDVHVQVAGEELVLTGTVTTAERRDTVMAIARAHADDVRVRNELIVLHCSEPDGAEVLP